MLKLLIILNLILLSGQVVLSFGRATQGAHLAGLQNRAQTLAAENQRLRESIYSASSLSHIWVLAERLNLQPRSVNFLIPLPVAAARP
ncbi:MAG: hypothetical protein UX80_C0001G0048 [Candidatus Amesbacteria bacterium GW2011_GWA2_47_11b]|uniref:Cell division protein FtsL n=3 Tax=Candidatus Amesiibacteriota TaxID=1752730 RepID=A0A0G1SH43_9BACT|nr:MAG: hypothetical protein UX42_C0016G0019 [Microgenomates group bacterium GW2011_GWC1_46_20]KKU58609.1 MAG: hypothetical protein UX80_C0001G0048 [Candidatus Amesbacteria bacterium GW2011_GWA2_47_11b]KKU68757.1 MAG: hypothetical protein UX92_C0018G0005 [Candidatus Amesbacteria bacterium GW2011_GWA1_47_20]KKU83752.1 MAG: hypothetical protein UY11_C0014G0008 [Candidatus Amesbacteria bacterium GW2011_GWC2_47_8]